jgi:hypothetical protein
VDVKGIMPPDPLAVRYVVGVWMSDAVRTYPFHHALVITPSHRPIAHMVGGWVVDAAKLPSAFVR